ncbi:MAG: 2-dehydropantoate 2-reductase [Oscillospiraceae bacterium]
MEIKKTALIGLGAIGSVYGRLLHHAYGSNFSVIAGGARAKRLRENGVNVNGEQFFPSVVKPGDAFEADFIIVSVKNYQLEQAIEDMRGFVSPSTVILPLLNGVTAQKRLQDAFPQSKVLYGLAIYIDAVRTANGVVNTKDGVIQFGEADNTTVSPEVRAVRDYLDGAGIQTEVCPDMLRAVWKKWMMNVGINQVSAVTRAPYGKVASTDSAMTLLHEAMMEVVALAKAADIQLGKEDAEEIEQALKNFSPNGKTSMLQDVEAKRQTEVEYFAGTVVQLGQEYHVPTPVNQMEYNKVRNFIKA